MLTVDYDRLNLRAGEMVLDLGAGFGRHAFESLRRGATVVACDLAWDELISVANTAVAMDEVGEIPTGATLSVANGDATKLPFADDSFDRIIASEVMEHIPDDSAALVELTRVIRPGGIIAITVPASLPEKICWKLSDEYYAPKSVGGHVRIYSGDELPDKMRGTGLDPIDDHRAHALHSPYWWIRCAVGPHRDIDDHPLTKAYHKLLVWDIAKAPALTRVSERLLNPVLGKSIIHYGQKPGRVPVPLTPESPESSATSEPEHVPA